MRGRARNENLGAAARINLASNDKLCDGARKKSLTVERNFITQHPNAPSDGIH